MFLFLHQTDKNCFKDLLDETYTYVTGPFICPQNTSLIYQVPVAPQNPSQSNSVAPATDIHFMN